ncbi:MAG: DUF1801 domain-containing protein [Chitinophagaceae bacterium]|nr:MAG: DUF1801 domain-containing protein [Chitinophagaceae bacterium]
MAKAAKIKTTETNASVRGFLDKLTDEQQKEDSNTILNMMEKATGEPPKMWGPSIIGFGNKRYKSPATGREVDWMKMGFSPRKANLSIYLISGLQKHEESLKKLGKHKTGVGCLYIKRLSEIDQKVLEKMIRDESKAKID